MALVAAAPPAVACAVPDLVAFQHPSGRGIVATFGVRRHPILQMDRLHPGIDYEGPVGDPVAASAAGRVLQSAFTGESGNLVVIQNGAARETRYAHLSRLDVKPDDCVTAGQIIGAIGTTGLAAGPHLHFEIVLDGKAIDPMNLLPPR